jgi:ribonuclease G
VLLDYKSFIDINGRVADKAPPQRNLRNRRPVPKEGQEILVQIIKEPIRNKGARVSTELSLPGRFLVLVPNSDVVGVSKKIARPQEKRMLKKLAYEIKPEGFGLIIRTVAENKGEQALRADLDNLVTQWRKLETKLKRTSPPALVFKDVAMASSVIRDLFTADVNVLHIDSKKIYREISAYLKDVAPVLASRVQLYAGKTPIFDHFGIETEFEKSLSRKVWMPSGGYLIFDQTEALVAIDVNSGKYVGGKQPEENILRVNLEAAREIARQLRLRDLGGIIVIDFIDMLDPKNKKRLYDEFKREVSRDRAQASISQISEFGLIEMTRERVRPSLLFAFSEPCPSCQGVGRVVSESTVLTRLERWIQRFKSQRKEWSVRINVHSSVARYLRRGLINNIRKMMWKYRLSIDIKDDDSLRTDEFKVYLKKDDTELTDLFTA